MIVAAVSPGAARRHGFGRAIGLVRVVPTVVLTVADPRGQNAVGGRIAGNKVSVARRRRRVGEIAGLRRTVHLVGSVGTIELPIAQVRLFHAHAHLTTKLAIDAMAFGFVRMIAAIVLPVTHFRLGHAPFRPDAGEKLHGTDAIGAELRIFVAPVRTMTVGSVASVLVGNALTVVTFELVLGASNVGTIDAP